MKRRALRWWMLVAMVVGGGTLFQSVGFTASNGLDFSCNRFVSNGITSGIDFCFLLDCQNGFFGGVFQPCNDPSTGAILLDCGNFSGGTTGGGTTTNGTTDGQTANNTTQ